VKNKVALTATPRTSQLLAANVCNVQVWAEALAELEREKLMVQIRLDSQVQELLRAVKENLDRAVAAERQLATVAQAERERCAFLVETLYLTMEAHKYPSPEERHLAAVVEAGCRGAFIDAIRAVPPPMKGFPK
jgi:hypothetical protein